VVSRLGVKNRFASAVARFATFRFGKPLGFALASRRKHNPVRTFFDSGLREFAVSTGLPAVKKR
jgi:hypothetical protein